MASFKKILFPTDFSENADAALAHALRLAGLEDGEVIVQHVVKSYFERNPHWTTLFDVRELEEVTGERVQAEFSRTVGDAVRARARIRQVTSEGRPAKQILALAETEKADLIVMGPGRGVVTRQVIRGAQCPVLSVDAEHERTPLGPFSRVLVGTDLSRRSRKLVNYAFDLRRLTGCEVDLLHAVELPEVIRFGMRQGHFTDAVDKLETWAENQMKNLTPHRALRDPDVRRHVQEGSPLDRIPSMDAANRFDMVILGTHGFGPVEKYFVGSTTERLLGRLRSPILTLKI